MKSLSMNEERKKRIIGASVALVVGGVAFYVLFGGSKPEKSDNVDIPQIKVTKKEETLEEGFKSRFGEDLIYLKEENEKLKKNLDELNKKTSGIEQDNKNLKEDVKNTNDMLLSDMLLPPPARDGEDSSLSKGIPPSPSSRGYDNTAAQSSPPTITVMTGLIAKGEPLGASDIKKEEIKKILKSKSDLIIPAGSFVKATLLSGVIAPTMGQGANQPVPVLIRVTDLTNLPNFFKADIKNCFMLAETKGNLATETVNFRLKTLACKRSDGSTLERVVDGYVTGENGVEGLSGRVVSKQGAIIARAFAAEFLGGIASAFQEAGNIVTTTGSGVVTTVDPNKTLETGLFSGAAGAFSRVSEFYMDLADNMVPVIEINAGRKVDIVFIKSVNLSLADTAEVGEK